jgi:hypothetical protein
MKFSIKNKSWLVSLGLVFLLSYSAVGQKDTTKVLFVGNSFTYFFNLSQVVTSMAATQDRVIYTRQSTVGGSTLKQHWNEEKGTRTREMLESQKWDYVVFNHHSLETIKNPEGFKEYSRLFTDLVRSKGAEPIFMMTWGYKANPVMINTIAPAYEKMALDLGVHLVPCGTLFAESFKWRPDLELFQDTKHPSSNGTYLLGLSFFKYFTKMSTADIPKRLTTKDINEELLYLIFMSQDDADFLQNLVDDFEFKYYAGK